MQSNIFLTLFAIFAFFALALPSFAAPMPAAAVVEAQEKRICQYTCTRDAEASAEPGSNVELLGRDAQPASDSELAAREALASPLDVVAMNERL
ncbi:hypothetical protein JAAARDRAFT_194919 [Jaapia argillacea MUCL 33604]|uniref:Uncharacterized protein n=1 Tax=Jaapia argillacea MUCL 33604 TaxID=933084 RepID=A0A067PYA1_9AGAM|nr:hypothetical protein JAAARDRAFT_194919 [Jaapia argillacea MUCL 33604]